MLKKTVIALIALFLIGAAALGARAVLAQETEGDTDPVPVPGGPMWQWQQDGEQADRPYGPGHMWGWSEDGEAPAFPSGPAYGHHGMMGGMLDGNTLLDIVAETLDMSVDEAWEALSQGVSIAALAEEQGVDPETIIAAASEAHATALQEAVAAGQLSQEQADWMQQNMEAMTADHIFQAWPGGFGPGAGPGFGPGGCHGYDDGDAPTGSFRSGPRGRGGMHGGWGGGWQQAPAAPAGSGA